MSKGETVNFDVVLVVIQSTVLGNCCTSNAVFFYLPFSTLSISLLHLK